MTKTLLTFQFRLFGTTFYYRVTNALWKSFAKGPYHSNEVRITIREKTVREDILRLAFFRNRTGVLLFVKCEGAPSRHPSDLAAKVKQIGRL